MSDPIDTPRRPAGLDMPTASRRQTLINAAKLWTWAGVTPLTINGPDGEHTFTARQLALAIAEELVAMSEEH
jgi:hypothetical protein